MNIKKPTSTFFLDSRKMKANGKYPLKLTVYFKPHKKRYNTNIDLTVEEWGKLNGKRLKDETLKEVKIKMNAIAERSKNIFDLIKDFNFKEFESLFFKDYSSKLNLSLDYWFTQYINQLEDDQIGTISSYNSTLSSLKKFKKVIELPNITKSFLQDYEIFMKLNGRSNSTIGIYLRQLRAIVNFATKEGALQKEVYPFKDYKIPTSRNIKKALDDKDLLKIFNYMPESIYHKRGYDLWLFSYLCNGMNITDILHLKPSNIVDDYLSFYRQKTKRTKKKDQRPINVYLHEKAKEIIRNWHNPDPNSEYLFPYLDKDISAKTAKHRVQSCIKYINKVMEEIREKIGIKQKIRTYEARHSFSTKLMRKGVSTQFIRDSLGHSSVAMTENYLGDFSDSTKMEYSKLLTEFD